MEINNNNTNNNISSYVKIIKDSSVNNQLENDIALFTKDTLEFSGRYSDKSNDYDFDRLFKAVDFEIAKAKEAAKEHAERQLKKKNEAEIQKRIDRQKIEAKVALMEKTGVLWSGNERSPEAKQIILQKASGIMSKYDQKQKIKEEQIEKSQTE